jgi:hypothetical protein
MKTPYISVIVGLDPTIHDVEERLLLKFTKPRFSPPAAEWIPAFAGMTIID